MPENTAEKIVSLHAGYETNGVYSDGFIARPESGVGRPGVVLLSGMGGLTWIQREITRRYARAGFVALSPDFMGGHMPDDITGRLQAKNSLDFGAAADQIIGGVDFLRSLPWVGEGGHVGVMGFCLGGGLSLLAAARSDKFDACEVYHQSLFPDTRDLENINCPMQCHYGTNDHSTPVIEVEAFTKTLDQAGKTYQVHWYEGMPHSFAQITPDADVPADQKAASDLSYERSFEFFHATLGSGASAGDAAED
ncbi:MAG: dienelactone hydrolase family protein [Rhodospirillales bacterium]|jgi:carboxymethylenebutenolidase|nr:dienelactone hydrolase family protein [Rhodospirillales bacterium]MBT4007640.1 dienelactone hydrolase family protein [Rhodospirillales bacterium]MBT5075956.1 dienelactone hydrolase family protein [Rhodospirillales bacterium]MBT5113001.1 dienelactone hydrolase family protein [Rhodospirillales bacterium]MBT5672877.1 dienelactone hydrolase family protein [Rhodospirillales bacterium]